MSALLYLPLALVLLFVVMGILVFVVLPRLGRTSPPHGAPQPVLSSASKQIKASRCEVCGGRRVQPSPSPYLYCDFCGALIDYDMRLAREMSGYENRPAKVWSDLTAAERPLRDRALQNRDFDGFRRSFATATRRHLSAFPEHFPHRIVDPAYREAMIHYLVELNLAVELDPELTRASDACDRTQAAVRYERSPGQVPRAVSDEHLEAHLRAGVVYVERFLQVAEPVRPLHPDGVSAGTLRRFTASRLVQNWLANLGPRDQRRFIDAYGLSDEYVALQPVPMQERHCGHCGHSLKAPLGARRALCATCGHYNDVARVEVACPTCSAPSSIPDDKVRFPCPYCRDELRVEG